MADEYDECLKCGAAVANYAKHRRWHQALENLTPGLEAEMERLKEEKKSSRTTVIR